MGIAKKGITALALTFSMAITANAATYEAADNSPESKLCVAAATQNKINMNQAVKNFMANSSLSKMNKNYKFIANNLYCNGTDVAEFAKNAGNEAVAKKLLKYRSEDIQIRDIAKMNHGTVSVAGSI